MPVTVTEPLMRKAGVRLSAAGSVRRHWGGSIIAFHATLMSYRLDVIGIEQISGDGRRLTRHDSVRQSVAPLRWRLTKPATLVVISPTCGSSLHRQNSKRPRVVVNFRVAWWRSGRASDLLSRLETVSLIFGHGVAAYIGYGQVVHTLPQRRQSYR